MYVFLLHWVFTAALSFLSFVLGLLVAVAPLDATALELESRRPSSWHELSCSEACGLFPRPGIEPMFLDWQVVS